VDDIVRVAKRACFRSADPAAQRAAA
jgi:hypothetical protein